MATRYEQVQEILTKAGIDAESINEVAKLIIAVFANPIPDIKVSPEDKTGIVAIPGVNGITPTKLPANVRLYKKAPFSLNENGNI